jgi:hypothetical protein
MLENEKMNVSQKLISLKKYESEKSTIFVKYTKTRLQVQKIFGFITLLPFCYFILFIFKFIMKYRFENKKQIRAQFQKIIQDNQPLIICANHLTFIDSCLISWALASNLWYFFHYKHFSWNLPAGDFFGKKKRYRIIAFLGKCIFIHRDACPTHHNEILSICCRLLSQGNIITIFPEGKRSRSGRFDPSSITYGVGKIIQKKPQCRVLCVYLRGDQQEQYSNYPSRNSNFYMAMKLLSPKTILTDREGCADLVQQIARVIKEQEDNYFHSKLGFRTKE